MPATQAATPESSKADAGRPALATGELPPQAPPSGAEPGEAEKREALLLCDASLADVEKAKTTLRPEDYGDLNASDTFLLLDTDTDNRQPVLTSFIRKAMRARHSSVVSSVPWPSVWMLPPSRTKSAR